MSVIEKILSHGELFPDKVAIQQKQEQKTYAMMSADIKRIARKFMLEGLKDNQYVVVVATNDYDFICTYFAIHLVGAVSVSLAPDIDDDYRASIIKKINPFLVVENCSDFTDDLASYSEIECSSVKAETLSEIVFTSGTTGQAKGVALTHKQVLTATMHIITQVRNNYSDIELLLMPLSHSFGMARMRTTLFARGTLVLGYPLQRLKNVFKAIELYKVTGLGLVPSGWKFIIQMSKDMIVKYSHQLKYIEFGSAALAPEDKLLVTEWFPQTHIVMHYGLTEVSRALFTHLHSDNHVAVGNLSRGAEVVILSEEDAILRVGEIGEIALKAKWMCTGYHDDSKLTKNSFVNGFLKTGDQGYVKGNHLFLTGRIREIINVGGKKVSPYRIEELMNDFDFVKESACAGYPDDQMGEVVHAYIVLNPKIEIMEDDVTSQLEKLIATKLPVYMRPSGYHYLESLPKTLTGKIQRGNLLQN